MLLTRVCTAFRPRGCSTSGVAGDATPLLTQAALLVRTRCRRAPGDAAGDAKPLLTQAALLVRTRCRRAPGDAGEGSIAVNIPGREARAGDAVLDEGGAGNRFR